jgi:hypothetical protein
MTSHTYIRLHHALMNEERFAAVRANGPLLGAWVQLALVADLMYPADAPMPCYVAPKAYRALVETGVVTERPHRHYRIPDLDVDRAKRASQGQAGADGRWRARDA